MNDKSLGEFIEEAMKDLELPAGMGQVDISPMVKDPYGKLVQATAANSGLISPMERTNKSEPRSQPDEQARTQKPNRRVNKNPRKN